MLKKSITRRNSLFAAFAGYLLFLILFSAYYIWKNPETTRATVIMNPSASERVDLPYSTGSTDKIRQFDVLLDIEFSTGQSTVFKIIPDDCVTRVAINNSVVNLRQLISGSLCNWSEGFEIDLAPYLEAGDNAVRVGMKDNGGNRGFDIQRSDKTFEAYLLKGLYLLLGFILSFLLARRLGFSVWIAIVIGLGVLVRVYYVWETPWSVRSYDVDGHLEYIKLIANNLAIPNADGCWVCYHPPLYYVLSALIFKTFSLFSAKMAFIALQVLSLLLNLGFILFVLMGLRKFIVNNVTYFAVAAMILFMPSMIMPAARIGNDVLLYFGYAAAFYFFIHWLKCGKGYWWMLFFTVVALWSKGNGVLVMGVLGIAYVLRMLIWREYRKMLKPVVTAAVVFALSIGTLLLVQQQRGSTGVVGNSSGLHSGLYVPNEPVNYLYFDLKTYIEKPFTSAWDDQAGRQYFWNYLLKSSLFGEFSFGGAFAWVVASALGVLYLLIIAGGLYGALRMPNETVIAALPFLVNGVILLAGAIYLRATVPAACSNDFRYILPSVISLAYFVGMGLEILRKKEVLAYWILLAVVLTFAGLGALFIFNV